MTFLEKYKEDNPNETIRKDCYGIGCPSQYGYEDVFEFCGNTPCEDCWNREMPNTEPKADKSFTVQSAYRKGKKDAWELANKIYTMSDKEFDDVFGYVHKEDIFCYLNYDEALEKMKAYEEAQIEVGDIVDVYGDIGVVSSLGTDKDRYHVLFNDGITNIYGKTIPIKKTGKHIDIQSIFEQIGE